jgi:hypothetical protein
VRSGAKRRNPPEDPEAQAVLRAFGANPPFALSQSSIEGKLSISTPPHGISVDGNQRRDNAMFVPEIRHRFGARFQ